MHRNGIFIIITLTAKIVDYKMIYYNVIKFFNTIINKTRKL